MLFPHVSEEVVDQFGHQSSRMVDPSDELGNYLIQGQGDDREGHRTSLHVLPLIMCHYIISLIMMCHYIIPLIMMCHYIIPLIMMHHYIIPLIMMHHYIIPLLYHL